MATQIYLIGDKIADENVIVDHSVFKIDGKVRARLCGISKALQNHMMLQPVVNCHYVPVSNDTVIGRVVEVQDHAWKVDVNTLNPMILLRKNLKLQDEQQGCRLETFAPDLREILQERDLVCLEVGMQDRFTLKPGTHTHGPLCNGVLITVPPQLIADQRRHAMVLHCGVYVILGKNGFIWIGLSPHKQKHEVDRGRTLPTFQPQRLIKFPLEFRQKITRVRNTILCLARQRVKISFSIIERAYDITIQQNFGLSTLFNAETSTKIVETLWSQQMSLS